MCNTTGMYLYTRVHNIMCSTIPSVLYNTVHTAI